MHLGPLGRMFFHRSEGDPWAQRIGSGCSLSEPLLIGFEDRLKMPHHVAPFFQGRPFRVA